jgi:ribonucleoside-diphosphate reductase beta chain
MKRDNAEATSYERLYRHWEQHAWSATAIDFSADRRRWCGGGQDFRQFWLGVGRFGGFRVVEKSIGEPLAACLPVLTPAAQRVLATQISDEARHAVFFDRFNEEVLGDAKPTHRLSPGMNHLLHRCLPDAVRRLRIDPGDILALCDVFVVIHLCIESVIGWTHMRAVRDALRGGAFPGFAAGFHAVMRDEIRHVVFGMEVLRSLLAADGEVPGHFRHMIANLSPRIDEAFGTNHALRAKAQSNLAKRLCLLDSSVVHHRAA